jgi:hypothetical protein
MVIEKLQSRGDEMAVLLLHDADLRVFKIIGFDDKLAETIGLKDNDEQDFLRFIASKKQRDLINDIYDDALGRDFIDMLKYLPHLTLVKADGEHVDFEFRAVREMPRNYKHTFKLILSSSANIQQKHVIMQLIHENITEQTILDNKANLPDASSTDKAIEIATNYHNELKMAFLYVDFAPQFVHLLPIIGEAIRHNLRQHDFIGLTHDNKLGSILLDVDASNLPLAINRLRMNLWQNKEIRHRLNELNLRFGAVMMDNLSTSTEIISMAKQAL